MTTLADDVQMSNARMADVVFTALCVWREVRHEPRVTKAAVAHVIKTRAENPNWWGSGVMGVLFKPLQFTSLTYKSDPQLTWFPKADSKDWLECLDVASRVLSGELPNPAPGATHYFSLPLTKPPAAWGKVELVRRLGDLEFYRTTK